MTSCPVCAGEPSPLGDSYLKCPACGMIYSREIPSLQSMRHYYGGGGLKGFRRRLFAPIRRMWMHAHVGMHRARARRHLSVISRFAPRDDVTFLEIGCNRGFLVEAAMEAGWNAYGREIAREQILPFLNTYPHMKEKVEIGRFPDEATRLEAGMFDVISAVHVIEHFADIQGAFTEVLRLLKKGGVFVADTCDSACAGCREQGAEWGELRPGEHLFIFNARNLERFAKQVGFSEMELAPEPLEVGSDCMLVVLRK